jgi:hypothetical protein
LPLDRAWPCVEDGGAARLATQACWTIASKRECAELARLLTRFPLRARKRRDFEIWARAVDRWAESPYDAGVQDSMHADMAADAAALRAVRRYVNSPPPARDGPIQDLLAYLGGFFSGEGCFGLSGLQPRAVVKLRRDDRAILELFAERFGLGAVRDHAPYRSDNPSVTWLICAGDELGAAVRLFEAAELRGRKRREFDVWREAAEERAFALLAKRRWDRARVARAAARLTASRAYRGPRQPPGSGAPGKRDEHDARNAYLDVLRAFAAERPDGALTCTAYAQARAGHPEWPTRNTLALAFGTWAQALAAAGLGSRTSAWQRVRQQRARPRE